VPFPPLAPEPADETALRAQLIRLVLPECQPQEGSPANTFTNSELQELQAALPGLNFQPRDEKDTESVKKAASSNVLDICQPWKEAPDRAFEVSPSQTPLDWHGAPRFAPTASVAREFRQRVREGMFTGPTNGVCPGFLQCNLVVLPQGKHAFDFLLFCQRNPKSCPLLEVCDTGSPVPLALAPGADLRTDCPRYVRIICVLLR
jgi:hypothetical protein